MDNKLNNFNNRDKQNNHRWFKSWIDKVWTASLSQQIDNKVPKVRKPNKITYLYTMIIYSPMSVPPCYLFYYLKIN